MRQRFPPDVIRYAVWLYYRCSLSMGDVEELLAEQGIEVSYETNRCWCAKFGPLIAANLRKLSPAPARMRHLDEMFDLVGGRHASRHRSDYERRANLPTASLYDIAMNLGAEYYCAARMKVPPSRQSRHSGAVVFSKQARF